MDVYFGVRQKRDRDVCMIYRDLSRLDGRHCTGTALHCAALTCRWTQVTSTT